MHQTLLNIPTHLPNGIPIFGFGIVLVVWLVYCVGYVVWHVRRHGWNAELYHSLPIFLLMSAVILWFLPAISKEGGLPIRGYGTMMLLGVVSGAILAAYRARRIRFSLDVIYTAAFWMVVPGIVGARLFYLIEYWADFTPILSRHGWRPFLWSLVNISEGGLVVYGGFIGGMIGLIVFVVKYRPPLLTLMDLLAPSMMLGLAFGRIGCLLNGCCYGGVCHEGIGIHFPASTSPVPTVSIRIPPYDSQVERGLFYGFTVSGNENAEPKILRVENDSIADRAGLKAGFRIENIGGETVRSTGDVHRILMERFFEKKSLEIETEGAKRITLPPFEPIPAQSLPVYPTQLLSAIDALILCLLLLAYDPFRRRDGELFALMITIYPITRFLIEILRSDEAAIAGTGMSISQNVSLVILLVAAGFWYYLSKRPKGFWIPPNAAT